MPDPSLLKVPYQCNRQAGIGKIKRNSNKQHKLLHFASRLPISI